MCLTVANLYPMEVTYSGQDLTELPPVHQVTLYRLVQEALNNAARHAKAAKARVKVSLTERQVLLTVEDNGEGFEVEPAMNIQRAGSGLGLIGMQERVGLIGGRLTIESSAGTGTTVTAEIPLC
jgi:signal transduction histidine kinase